MTLYEALKAINDLPVWLAMLAGVGLAVVLIALHAIVARQLRDWRHAIMASIIRRRMREKLKLEQASANKILGGNSQYDAQTHMYIRLDDPSKRVAAEDC